MRSLELRISPEWKSGKPKKLNTLDQEAAQFSYATIGGSLSKSFMFSEHILRFLTLNADSIQWQAYSKFSKSRQTSITKVYYVQRQAGEIRTRNLTAVSCPGVRGKLDSNLRRNELENTLFHYHDR